MSAVSDSWHFVKTQEIAPEPEVRKGEGEIEVSFRISPYDLPEAYKVVEEDDSIRIEFRYLNQEPDSKQEWETHDGFRLRLGKWSGRIHAMEFDRGQLAETQVLKLVFRQLESEKPKKSKHYQAVESLLQQLLAARQTGRSGLALSPA